MAPYKQRFLALAIAQKALKFGQFELKSGRISPYFFNAGAFHSAAALAELGSCYAAAIADSGVAYDVIFGPAYKGIPLATSTAVALANEQGANPLYCFNRKEAKAHGEGGSLVGAPLTGRVLIVDDVITAGTAIREVLSIISSHQATPAAAVVGLDRRERGPSGKSAIQEVEAEFGIPVISIASIDDVIEYLENASQDEELIQAVRVYRQTHGV